MKRYATIKQFQVFQQFIRRIIKVLIKSNTKGIKRKRGIDLDPDRVAQIVTKEEEITKGNLIIQKIGNPFRKILLMLQQHNRKISRNKNMLFIRAQETQKKEQQDRKIKRHHSNSRSKSKSPETKIIKKGRGHMNKKLFGWRSDDYDQSNNYLKRIDQKIITQNKSFKKKDPEPQPQPINIDQSDKKKQDQRGYDRKDKDFRQNDRKSDKQFIQKQKWIHDKYEDTLKDKNSQDKEKQRPRGSPVYK